MKKWLDFLSYHTSKKVGSTWALASAIFLIIGWACAGPYYHWSDSHSLFINTTTTIVTFLMVFLLQREQTRDSAISHMKLDELLRAVERAREDLVGAQHRPDEPLE